MENLKFRAWDKEDKRMKEVFNLDFHRYTAVVGFRLSEPKSFLGDNPLIIMQSTGLKDKNGVEIFEGDIVIEKSSLMENYEPKKIVVVWNEWDCSFNLNTAFNYKVIGNKYKHPHLLKE